METQVPYLLYFSHPLPQENDAQVSSTLGRMYDTSTACVVKFLVCDHVSYVSKVKINESESPNTNNIGFQ